MATLNVDIPRFYCLLRKEFLYDGTAHHGEFVKVCVFGAASVYGRALGFHVLTENGAVIWRLPIHSLCHRDDAPARPLDWLQFWDCFAYEVSCIAFDRLANCRVRIRFRDGSSEGGQYMFTLDWFGNEDAEEAGDGGHKCAHVVALDDGNFAAQPNNRIQWFCPAFVTPWTEKPDYLTNTIQASGRSNAKPKHPTASSMKTSIGPAAQVKCDCMPRGSVSNNRIREIRRLWQIQMASPLRRRSNESHSVGCVNQQGRPTEQPADHQRSSASRFNAAPIAQSTPNRTVCDCLSRNCKDHVNPLWSEEIALCGPTATDWRTMIEKNTITCGNTFELLDSVEDDSVDLVVCDGPYGVTQNSWDKIDSIQEFNLGLIARFSHKLKEGGALYLFGKPDCIDFVDYRPYLNLRSKIVWYQPSRLAQGRLNYTNNYDIICYFIKGKRPARYNLDDIRVAQLVELEHRLRCENVPSVRSGPFGKTKFNEKGKNPGDVWGDIKQLTYKSKELVCRDALNTIQKPERLIERLILGSSNVGDLVLDPFAGVGTCPVVCSRHEREFIAFEINPEYVKYGTERLDSEGAKMGLFNFNHGA